MKNVFGKTILISALFSLGLAACSKGGGSSAPATTTALGVIGNTCAYNPANPAACSYIGPRSLTGTLTVTDAANFQAFLASTHRCFGYTCSVQPSMYLQLSVSLGYQFPGPASFSLSSSLNGTSRTLVSSGANAYLNSGNNGFQLAYVANSYGYGWPYNQAVPVANTQQLTLQVLASYADATHNTLNTQLVYLGHVIATGVLSGYAVPSYYNNGIAGSTSFYTYMPY